MPEWMADSDDEEAGTFDEEGQFRREKLEAEANRREDAEREAVLANANAMNVTQVFLSNTRSTTGDQRGIST